jgi:hypothetical protein
MLGLSLFGTTKKFISPGLCGRDLEGNLLFLSTATPTISSKGSETAAQRMGMMTSDATLRDKQDSLWDNRLWEWLDG